MIWSRDGASARITASRNASPPHTARPLRRVYLLATMHTAVLSREIHRVRLIYAATADFRRLALGAAFAADFLAAGRGFALVAILVEGSIFSDTSTSTLPN